MVGSAVVLGVLGLGLTGGCVRLLLGLHRMRKLSEVTGTVVARDQQFTGKTNWTYPVVEFAAPDGSQIRRTFRQIARPTIGRKLRIVYDPSALPKATIYSAWLLIWLWLLTAAGLALLAGCISLAVTAG